MGLNGSNGDILASYATGAVSGGPLVGGLVGRNYGGIQAGYWDVETSGTLAAAGYVGDHTGFSEGYTTEELQRPTGLIDIYGDAWDVDADNADGDDNISTGRDDFWDFGNPSQCPLLKVDIDGDGTANWWEMGEQNGQREIPTPTPTPTLTPTATPTPTITPTPSPKPTATNTPTPTTTPTLTPTATATPVVVVITATVGPPPPTQTPVIVVVTATPASPPPTRTPVAVVVAATPVPDTTPSGGCSAARQMPLEAAAANVLLLVVPLGILGSLRCAKRERHN